MNEYRVRTLEAALRAFGRTEPWIQDVSRLPRHFPLIMEPVAPALSTDDHVCVLFAANSVPILRFSGDSVGIQGCVPLNNVLSSMVRNPVVPQIHEQIVETVNAILQEWISRRSADIPVAPAEEETVVQGAPTMQKQVITQGERVEEITQITDVPVLFFLEECVEVLPQERISEDTSETRTSRCQCLKMWKSPLMRCYRNASPIVPATSPSTCQSLKNLEEQSRSSKVSGSHFHRKFMQSFFFWRGRVN